MGMPEQPQNGMNIAPDGTVYEILEDGTIKRIGKVSSDGSFEPFGGAKEGIREQDGIIYRVVNGKEVKIGRILPNGEIETINQRIRNEAEVSRNNVKIVAIVSLLTAFLALLYFINAQQERKVETKTQAEAKADTQKVEIAAKAEAERIEAKKAEEARKMEQAKAAEQAKADAKKAEEDRKRKEAEAKKAEEDRKSREAEEDRKRMEVEQAKAEAKKAEEERKKREAKAKKAQSGGGTKIGSLYWSKRSRSKMNWSSAKKYCEELTEGGYSDWRLPNIDELRTLIKNCSKAETEGECKVSEKKGCLALKCWHYKTCICEIQSNNGEYYSNFGDEGRLWSSSKCDKYGAWEVGFYGRVGIDCYETSSPNIDSFSVRCVRDAK